MNSAGRSTPSTWKWGQWGSVIGVSLAACYAASPVTFWFAITTAGLFLWAGRGLGDRERRYVWGVLAVAIAIRVVAVAALFLGTDNNQLVSFFWDGDGAYLKLRALAIRNVWMGVQISPVDLFNAYMPFYGWSSFIYVMAYLQYLIGPAPYGVHLLNVSFFVAAAVMIHRLIRSTYGRAPALLGFGLMLLLPTLIAWSVSALKESLCVFLIAVSLRLAIVATRRAVRMRHRLVGISGLAAAIVAGNTVRPGLSVIMVLGLGAGFAASVVVRRAIVAILVVLCLPFVASRLWEVPRVQAPIMAQLKSAAAQHRASFFAEGASYQLLDDRFYRAYPENKRPNISEMTPDEGLRFAARAPVSFVAFPLPWQISPRVAIVLVTLPQQLVWYMLVFFSCVGVFVGLRRDALVTCMLAGLSLAGAAAVALNNGNIGTMVRFRDLIVPSVVWLSALGATAMGASVARRGAASKPRVWASSRPVASNNGIEFHGGPAR